MTFYSHSNEEQNNQSTLSSDKLKAKSRALHDRVRAVKTTSSRQSEELLTTIDKIVCWEAGLFDEDVFRGLADVILFQVEMDYVTVKEQLSKVASKMTV